jgi:hypothetical protein
VLDQPDVVQDEEAEAEDAETVADVEAEPESPSRAARRRAACVGSGRRWLQGRGDGPAVCRRYLGVDGSENVVRVACSIALHDVEDRACLVPGGRPVVTVITSHDARATTEEPRTNRVVDEYFVPGPRKRAWHDGTVGATTGRSRTTSPRSAERASC